VPARLLHIIEFLWPGRQAEEQRGKKTPGKSTNNKPNSHKITINPNFWKRLGRVAQCFFISCHNRSSVFEAQSYPCVGLLRPNMRHFRSAIAEQIATAIAIRDFDSCTQEEMPVYHGWIFYITKIKIVEQMEIVYKGCNQIYSFWANCYQCTIFLVFLAIFAWVFFFRSRTLTV